MLTGALIGLIVGVIFVVIKSNKEKRLLAPSKNADLIDSPEFSSIFYISTEEKFKSKSLKFYDYTGYGYIKNDTFYFEDQSGKSLRLAIEKDAVGFPELKKRKLTWVSFKTEKNTFYITCFTTNLFSVDRSSAEQFASIVKQKINN